MSFASAMLKRVYPAFSARQQQAAAAEAPEPAGTPYFFLLFPGEDILNVLNGSYHIFIESGEPARLEPILGELAKEACEFALSITTSTAYSHNISEAVSIILTRRYSWVPHKSLQIQTCLQEAIINAIIHGNLEIEGKYQTQDEFEAHCALVDNRLAEEPYRSRRLLIRAWREAKGIQIAVSDEGRGFAFAPDNTISEGFNGRGLYLIQRLADRTWFDSERQALIMHFI